MAQHVREECNPVAVPAARGIARDCSPVRGLTLVARAVGPACNQAHALASERAPVVESEPAHQHCPAVVLALVAVKVLAPVQESEIVPVVPPDSETPDVPASLNNRHACPAWGVMRDPAREFRIAWRMARNRCRTAPPI